MQFHKNKVKIKDVEFILGPRFFQIPWPWRVLWFVLTLAVLSVGVVALHPRLRIEWQSLLLPERKELLASVTGDLLGNGSEFTILKFSTRRGLIIEIQMPPSDPQLPFQLIDRIFIPDRHDGFFSLRTTATQLAILDIDGDGIPEIIAPSFDHNLVAHLNPMRLNPMTKKIEILHPDNF